MIGFDFDHGQVVEFCSDRPHDRCVQEFSQVGRWKRYVAVMLSDSSKINYVAR